MTDIAYLRIEKTPKERFNAFYEGLSSAGYSVSAHEPRRVRPGDVLVIWNKGGPNETYANCFEGLGGTVLVAENGYIGKDSGGHQLYALARHDHNGAGAWNVGGPKFGQLNIELKPWRSYGSQILVCPNRHIGSKLMRMPFDFAVTASQVLRKYTKRPILVRPHPGNWQASPPKVPIKEALQDIWAVVIWSSSAGVHALVEGIPVFYCAPHWILSGAADNNLAYIENPTPQERLSAFERLAWAQWTIDELRKGEAFECLLRT